MENDILLTIAIPVYNVEKYLNNLFECLNDIKMESVEFLFVNDGSTDNSQQMIEEFKKNNNKVVLINQQNKGLPFVRNILVKNARGKYLEFLDPDDLIIPNSIPILIDALEKENADTICVKSKNVKEKFRYESNKNYLFENFKYSIHSNKDLNEIFVQFLAQRDVLMGMQNRIFKMSVVKTMPNFPNVFKDVVAEDTEFAIRFLPLCKKILITTSIYHFYRMRKGSIMHDHFNPKFLEILNCVDGLLSDKYSDEVHRYAYARKCLTCMYVIYKIAKSNYDDKEKIKHVYGIFKDTHKYVNKCHLLPRYQYMFNRFCLPFMYLMLRKKMR